MVLHVGGQPRWKEHFIHERTGSFLSHPVSPKQRRQRQSMLCTGWQRQGPDTQAGGICLRCQSITRPKCGQGGLCLHGSLSHDPFLKPVMFPTLTQQFPGFPSSPESSLDPLEIQKLQYLPPTIKCDQPWWGKDGSSQAPSGERLS